ncbi:MAG: pilus assembly protein TadG-related protein, partial [Planctomycetota bacterium]
MPQLAFRRRPQTAPRERRGVVLVMSALLIVVVFAMAAMAIDVGYMMLTKTQLQAAADAGALAAGNALHKPRREVKSIAKDFVTLHKAAGRQIKRGEAKVEIGVYDMETRSFRAEAGVGNAVRVTARRDGESLFFARVIGTDNFSTEATAISMANPKDIALVIDLSGSMNDDTEPAWATSTVNAEFGPQGYPTVGTDLMQDLYDDFGYGSFPGRLEYLGRPVGVPQGSVAYAELTTDDGPLSRRSVRFRDRIVAGDSEQTRREKSYRWIIENQLARLLPEARPRPTVANYPYWEKYIDYV